MSYFPQSFASYSHFSHVFILSFLFLFITGKTNSKKKWKQSSTDIRHETVKQTDTSFMQKKSKPVAVGKVHIKQFLRSSSLVWIFFLSALIMFLICYEEKESFADVLQNRYSSKFHKFHKKTLALESLFNKVACLKTCKFIRKILQKRCSPVKSARFSRTPPFTEYLWWLLMYVPVPYISTSKKYSIQRRIQKPVKHLRWSYFCENGQQLSAVNYFCKNLHLRCLTGFWIRLWDETNRQK